MRNSNFLFACVLAFASFSASTFAADPGNALFMRQNSKSGTATSAADGVATSGEGTPVQGAVSGTTASAASGSGSKSAKSGSSGKSASSSQAQSTSMNAYAGGVVMETPSLTDGYEIYKIGYPVTFVWNYTSLQVTPTAINVEAYCTDGSTYFTIAANVSGDTTQAIWDTGAYQSTATIKLPVATYTLYIYDASKARTAIASGGYLSYYNSLTFGMYTPEAAVPLASFQCATCDFNGGTPLLDSYMVRMLLGMGLLTALSFTWFISGVIM
ncbi:hypothetical protein RUND412_000062 [Rhizina undulata]